MNAESTQTERLSCIKAMYEAMQNGDAETMRKLLDPDFVIVEADSLPYFGRRSGIVGLLEVTELFFKTWEDLQIDIDDFTTSDTRVAVHLRFSAKSRRTGKSVSMPMVEVWRFEREKLVELLPFYWDTKLVGGAAG